MLLGSVDDRVRQRLTGGGGHQLESADLEIEPGLNERHELGNRHRIESEAGQRLVHFAFIVAAEFGDLLGNLRQVGPSSVLGIVYRTGALEVDAPIKPKELEYLAPAIGRAARVRAGGETYDAEAVRVSSIVAPKTRLASLFLTFAEHHPPDSLPRPGTFVELKIEGPSYQDVYVLPESVLQEHFSVWVVEDGVLKSFVLKSFVPQTLGHTSDGWVVEVFDAGEGLVVGTLPGASEGLAVEAKHAATSG